MPIQRALELADVRDDLARDELDHVGCDRDRALLGFGAEDRDARLEIRRRQVGDQTPLEPRPKPFLEGQDRLRRPVAGEDDLLAVLMDRIERVEELLLGPLLVGDELDVIDEEEVDPAVARPELVDLALLDAGDELVRELLGGRVDHALAREPGDDLVADGVHQVRSCPAPRRRTGTAGCRHGPGARRPIGSRRARAGSPNRR